ncbi:MAG: ribosome biogenesis GTPase Der [Candidatus Riflebacteria bacterium]|nr:ribosome biogenesis GTPase Der [Candidatus Riflebacteria bacterium]
MGRPNVGKSSLFNRLVERREALVHDQPGVTRDRIYGVADWCGKAFEVIDTGGLEPGAAEPLKNLVERQVNRAMDESRVIVFVVDGIQGVTALDQYIAKLLHRQGRPVVVAVNKIDTIQRAPLTADFYPLGFGEPVWVSAVHGAHVDALLDQVMHLLERAPAAPDERPATGIRVAFLGKPNAGKSTLINRLVGQERLLVHEEPGTTRDSIMVPFCFGGRDYTLVDTAGIRRKAKISSAVEKLSIIAASRALERAHLAVLVLDGQRGLDAQDKRVAGLIEKARKPCVVAVNKWDTVDDKRRERGRWEARLLQELHFLSFCPRIYMSGLTGHNVSPLMTAVDRVDAARKLFYPAKRLTAMVKEASIIHQPPSRSGRRLTVYYVTQLKNRMATFVLKVNDSTLVHFSYERYLENTFRQYLGFEGVPLTLNFQDKGRAPRRGAGEA